MTPAQTQALETLLAKEAIRELVFAYSRAVDRGDNDLLESLYHPDARDEHGINPSGTIEEFFQLMRRGGRSAVLQHAITNHFIKVDGDRAEGEVYLIAYHLMEGDAGPKAFILGARYLDRYERRAGTWKFAHRLVVADWVEHRGGEVVAAAPEIAGMVHGRRGPDDPSYGFFRLFPRGGI